MVGSYGHERFQENRLPKNIEKYLKLKATISSLSTFAIRRP